MLVRMSKRESLYQCIRLYVKWKFIKYEKCQKEGYMKHSGKIYTYFTRMKYRVFHNSFNLLLYFHNFIYKRLFFDQVALGQSHIQFANNTNLI